MYVAPTLNLNRVLEIGRDSQGLLHKTIALFKAFKYVRYTKPKGFT